MNVRQVQQERVATMIKPVTMYDVFCDRCGIRLSQLSGDLYEDEFSAELSAYDSEWRSLGGKFYCPDCLELNSDCDEYVVKPERYET